jgi:hypothetical protein
MTLRSIRDWTAKHRWLLAFTAVIFGGYTLGKDAALRDNRLDASAYAVASAAHAPEKC